MAGIDVAGHGLRLAGFAAAGVGPSPLVWRADPVRLVDRRGRGWRWPAAALAVSLLAHGVAVMLLLPNRSRPLAVPMESSFELVFEPVAETALGSTLSFTALLGGGQEGVDGDPPATMTGRGGATPEAAEPSSMPASEPRDFSPLPPAVAPGAPAPRRQAARPVRQAAPPQRPVSAAQVSAPPGAASPPVDAGTFVPPSPVAGMETNRAPAYPQSALRRGEQGNVMLRVSVSADGAALAVDLAASSGYASLDGAAEAAVGRWRFNPATRGGTAVAAIADVPIRFRLAN